MHCGSDHLVSLSDPSYSMSGRSLYLPNLQHPITMCVIHNQLPKQEEPPSCATAMLGDSMGRITGPGLLWAASRGSKSCPAEASLNHSFEGHSCTIYLFTLSQDGIAPIKEHRSLWNWIDMSCNLINPYHTPFMVGAYDTSRQWERIGF